MKISQVVNITIHLKKKKINQFQFGFSWRDLYNIYVNNKQLGNMENSKKFMNALIKVAKLLYPNLVIESKRTECVEHPNGVNMTYEINGYDKETMLNVTILSRGFVLGGKGTQIEIIENGVTRYFPFFGFNWTYLMV